jgi:hypothetical protein
MRAWVIKSNMSGHYYSGAMKRYNGRLVDACMYDSKERAQEVIKRNLRGDKEYIVIEIEIQIVE